MEDLRDLCRSLNSVGAHYLVVGGFAIRAAGYDRRTMDVDLLVEPTPENEQKVIDAVSTLPDGAASELRPGEIAEFVVVRVADEIVVDLMSSASGIGYSEASHDVVVHDVGGVAIPFASPELLWKMKGTSSRDKDASDRHFLAKLLGRSLE